MKPSFRWPILALPAIVLGVALLPNLVGIPAYAAEGSFERTLTVTGPVELDVSTGSGHIEVRSGDATTVRIHGSIRASSGWHLSEDEAKRKVRYLESNPPIEQHGNIIRIGRVEDSELTRNVSIGYDLVAPAQTRLHSRTGSGSQSVVGIHGPVQASTGSGNLKLEDIGDEVRAETGSGNVQLRSVKGSAHTSTGSGSINASAIAGSFVASTGSGDVRLEQTGSGDGKVETGSGSVELHGVRGALRVRAGSGGITAEGEPAGDWSLHTGAGSITVRVPSQAVFDLDAHTNSGTISSQHPITVQGTIGRGELRGKVGQGGFRLELRTGSGNIHID